MDEATTRERLRDILETQAPNVGVENDIEVTVDNHISIIKQQCDGDWDEKVAANYVEDLQQALNSPQPESTFDDIDNLNPMP